MTGSRYAVSIWSRIEGLPIIVVFALILALFMYTAPEVFLQPNIYTTLLSTAPPLILLAAGLTFVIGAGEIDLSFPAIIAFSGFVFAILFKDYHLGWLAVLGGLASGVLVGFINGLIIARIGIPSFIATLGTQFFWSGMATVLSGGKSYALRGAEESSVYGVMVGVFGDPDSIAWQDQISVQAVWVLLIMVALWFVLNRHRFGEHVLFIGDSNDVARVVGIDVGREKIKLFTLMGALAGVAAMLLTLENKNYFGNQGQGYLLTAIAAVLIGGTSIFGGRATLVGSVFGCFIIWILEAGLVASGLTGAWVRTVQGLIFLIAIIFYLLVEEPARRAALLARLRPSASKQRTGGNTMKTILLAATALLALGGAARAEDPPGKGVTIYMQMGGNPGDGSTLARQTGASAAAEALGAKLNAQFSAWAPETMITQFKQALAAKPSCIVIMGHPGSDAFQDLVKQAVDQGVVVTDGNSPLTALQANFGTSGFGYAGVDLYAGGTLTANSMIKAGGLKSGDQAMVYGVFSQAERGQSEKGLADTLEKAGLKVDRLEITQEANTDPTLAIPVLTAYVQSHPDLKAIGTQHGGVTGVLAEVLKKAGKKPGQITVGGIDLAPATIDGLKSGYVSATLDQLLYLQGFMPVLQCVMSAKYKMPGLSLNTGAGVITPKTIGALVPLIDAGIR